MVSLAKRDIVAPVESATALSLAVEQRVAHAPTPFDPTAGGAFTHLTTGIETTISATISSTLFSSATSMTSGDVVNACSTLVDQVNENRLLISRIAYILAANGMTT